MSIRIDVHHYFHHLEEDKLLAKLNNIALSLTSLTEKITMDNATFEASLGAIKTTLVKVGGEIDAFKSDAAANVASLQTAIAALEAELANTGGPTPASVVLLEELTALSVALDGKIEDLPSVPVPV